MSEISEHTTPENLHVLWHNFIPSPQLTNTINIFARSINEPRFSLKSTKQVGVSSVDYAHSKYHEREDAAKKVVDEARDVQFIIGAMRTRTLKAANNPNGTVPDRLRLAFQVMPNQQAAFNRLEESLNVFQPEVQDDLTKNHYLYLDVLSRRVAWMAEFPEEREELERNIARDINRRLFSATVTGITGHDNGLVTPS